jgi:hypothetical protein
MVVGEGLEGWVDAMVGKMQDVGVCTLRDFIGSVLRLNLRLQQAGHRHLHDATVHTMLEEAMGMTVGRQLLWRLKQRGEGYIHRLREVLYE